MGKWKERAEQFAAEKRRMTRDGLLSESAIQAGNYLGLLMHRLDEHPELEPELKPLFEAFMRALNANT